MCRKETLLAGRFSTSPSSASSQLSVGGNVNLPWFYLRNGLADLEDLI